jgi:type VII secretion protein EccB
MASRTDQLQSYQFLTQRVISALVMRETDPRQSPLRRGIGAIFVGLMVAVMTAAGFGVYGLLTKVGGSDWKTSGAVVIEKESGASFIYINGVLHPTLNYASALLAAGAVGQSTPNVFRVSSNSLLSVPRGLTYGIPNAPNSLPAAGKEVGLPWSMCVVPGQDSQGHAITTVDLAVSLAPTGAQTLSTNQALLVKDKGNGETVLVWHGRRHLVQHSGAAVPKLFGFVTVPSVGTAFINSLVAGTDVAPIPIVQYGQPSGTILGRNNGNVLETPTGTGRQDYLVLDDGLVAINQFQLLVLQTVHPDIVPIPVPAEFNAGTQPKSRKQQASGPDSDLPSNVPQLQSISANDLVCAATTDSKSSPTVSVGGSIAGLDQALLTTGTSTDGAPLAERILVPGGRVAIVRAIGAPSDPTTNYFVVTDLGIRYPVATPAVLNMLGYASTQAIDVPVELVSRIPAGPTLDPAAALAAVQ